ncbi:MAG: hypothetical protein K8I27_17370 [Planctomycetes bacterium]|nr:hypothetical protein [Planctomycetota bacterium]
MEPSDYQPFDPQLHDYVDGRMSADDERDFARKLERNPELKKQAEALGKALALLKTLPVLEPKAGFDDRVIGRVREEKLAERARSQIVSAPVPIWQHIVQVGLGAAAAALVLAVIGVPGMFAPDDEINLSSSGGEDVAARVMPAEADLLPVLADHRARFESLHRSVACTRVDDPHEQRKLIALELEYSDLERRNRWLREAISDLPANRRLEYADFLDALEAALATIQHEVSASLQESRPVDVAAIEKAMGAVRTPRGEIEHYQLSLNSGELAPEDERVGADSLDDVAMYSLVRRAEYRHDHRAVLDAVRFYARNMQTGRFRHHANASAVGAYLRLGQDREAAARFAADFGDYDEDLTPEQLQVIRGMLTEHELERLNTARQALRNE